MPNTGHFHIQRASQALGSSELIKLARKSVTTLKGVAVIFFRHSIGIGVVNNSRFNIPDGTAMA